MAEDANSSSADWCTLSETRLLKKLLHYKPAGITKRFQMLCLTLAMNEISDQSDDSDIEDLVSNDDLQTLRIKNEPPDTTSPSKKTQTRLTFEPTYAIRPTPQQLWEKLESMYDLETMDAHEYFPDELHKSKVSDFFLPDGEFSEMIRVKEEESHAAAVSVPAASRGRRRRESGDTVSSRSSTPVCKEARRS